MDRREYLKKTLGGAAILGAAGFVNPDPILGNTVSTAKLASLANLPMADNHGNYTLADLPYPHNALEPHIDEQTMRLHHGIHHQGYVNGLNNALAKLAESRESGDYSLVKHWSREVSFHGGGHYLHTLFWGVMTPNGGGEPQNAALRAQINKDFGSFDRFKAHFLAASNAVEGSGWGVLAWEPVGQRLIIHQVEKQQDMSTWSNIPLLLVDVWEHAYYLRYQNRRAAYTEAFMNVVNWNEVARRLEVAMG
jgi:superoxide dismutase, Fe-Mn family